MNYEQAIIFIESREKFGINLGLSRVRSMLSLLGDPQDKFQSIHIAGTNGKGSVAAMLSSILTNAGLRAGLYTSPHLISYTERIRINDNDISEKKFAEAADIVKKVFYKNRKMIGDLTVFEMLTCTAFVAFERAGVKLAILEVGLGGRLDATNVVRPLVSVITNVDLDHTEVLGKTIRQIATEKAGIIKKGAPVVTAAKGQALRVISGVAKDAGTGLVPVHAKPKMKPPLFGEHQGTNLSIVLKVLGVLGKRGVKVGKHDVQDGLGRTRWSGRFQIVSKKPMIILDGAHNPSGAVVLKNALISFKVKRPLTLILGILRNKDIRSIIRTLVPLADTVIATRSTHPNAAPSSVIKSEAQKYAKNIMSSKDVAGALKGALRPGEARTIVVSGSLFTVADAMKALSIDSAAELDVK